MATRAKAGSDAKAPIAAAKHSTPLLPFVKLPRGSFLSLVDLIWLIPPVVHMFVVCLRPYAVDFFKDQGVKLDGMPQYNIMWGACVQFFMVSTFAGDGFNPVGLMMSTPMGYKRLPKIMLMVGSVYLLAFGLKLAEKEGVLPRGFVKKEVIGSLGSPPLCGINAPMPDAQDSKKKTGACEMQLCGVVESLTGTCQTMKGKGCCMKPEVYVIDELRSFFALSFCMRMFVPYVSLGGLATPFWAAVIQAGIRLSPSCISAALCNPNPAIFKAALTGNYEVIPYVLAGTAGGSFFAWLAATVINVLLSRVFPPGPKKTAAAPADAKKPVPVSDNKKLETSKKVESKKNK